MLDISRDRHFSRAHSQAKIAVVVEDEHFVRFEIADALMDAGWEVIEYASGEPAVELVGNNPHVALLVTDIRLPGGVNGWDVAERYRAANKEVAVIYCSATPPDPRRQVPQSRFLTKPCRSDAIVRTASEVAHTSQ